MSQRPSQFPSLESNAQHRTDVRRRGSLSAVVIALPLAIVVGVALLSSPVTTAAALTTLVVLAGFRRSR